MFGRANYSYKDRYMATVSFRREGSSKFGVNNRWGNFWAVSGGWRLSNEAFMRDVGWISDLKVRLGYGVTGNNGFGNGYTTRMYKANDMWPTNGVWQPGYGSIRNINPDLKWEEKSELNFGLDFSLFNDRLWGKFDLYFRQVDDMLYLANAPMPPMVHDEVMKNIGTSRTGVGSSNWAGTSSAARISAIRRPCVCRITRPRSRAWATTGSSSTK